MKRERVMQEAIRVPAEALQQRVAESLAGAGADAQSVEAATRAMMHASLVGVDSHGVRLTEHYGAVMRGGRVNPRPAIAARRTGAATGMIDADDALGHLAGYRAMQLALELAGEAGIGAVGVVRSSHFGAAGAYAMAAAEAGMIGFATTNSDSLVAPFEGSSGFHGTNPVAFAAPVAGGDPWLLDMATSSIPFNRVLFYRSMATMLPEGVAADAAGMMTRDPELTRMLMPLGGADFGFKGAALAGLATLFSAVLTGSALDHEMLRMTDGGDVSTPRDMGHFFIAIDPARFVARQTFDTAMQRYLAALRAVPSTVPGGATLAPGDREWRIREERRAHGIPIDPDTARFLGF